MDPTAKGIILGIAATAGFFLLRSLVRLAVKQGATWITSIIAFTLGLLLLLSQGTLSEDTLWGWVALSYTCMVYGIEGVIELFGVKNKWSPGTHDVMSGIFIGILAVILVVYISLKS